MEPDMPGDSGLLRNGGFEMDDWRWYVPADGIATVSAERAASGEKALKIVDKSRDTGSNVSSGRIAVEGAGAYELRGKVLGVSGHDQGVGLYIRFTDANRKLLNPIDSRGNMAGIGSVGGSSGKWQAFAIPFDVPEGATHMQVWIHSYNAAEAEAYLDDLAIVRKDTASR